jgi:uncharacterized protein YdhG (YjbR/CyaY superfamily)
VTVAPRAPAGVDAYVAGFPPDVRAILERLRAIARAAAPDAEETISYGIPTFKRDGARFHFAAFRKHVGLYPPVRDAALARAAAKYANDKGNLAFPLDAPMPWPLIERIAKRQLASKA